MRRNLPPSVTTRLVGRDRTTVAQAARHAASRTAIAEALGLPAASSL